MMQVMGKSILVAATFVIGQSIGVNVNADDIKLNDNTKRLSYSLGYQIGGDFKRQGVEMDAAAVVKGIEDALNGSSSLIPPKAMGEILSELKRKVVRKDQQTLKANSRENRRETELRYLVEGRDFLKTNASKPGVQTTHSGLQYRILEPGTGRKPEAKDRVTVHYRGTLINGNEFDSSYKNDTPATFSLNGVIPGWTEGLQLIGEGGKIELYVPYALAYRNRGPLAHRTLIFDVELISVGNT